MKGAHKERWLNGIIVMSQPVPLVIAVASMLVAGWIAYRDLPLLLVIIAAVYLIVSILGGQLAKSSKKEAQNTPR